MKSINQVKFAVAVLAVMGATGSFAQGMSTNTTTPSAAMPSQAPGAYDSTTTPSAAGYRGTAPQGTSIPSSATQPADSSYTTPSTSGNSAAGYTATGASDGYGSGAASRAYKESSPMLNPNNVHAEPRVGAQDFNLYSGGN